LPPVGNLIIVEAPDSVDLPDQESEGVPVRKEPQQRPGGVPPTEPDPPWIVYLRAPSELREPHNIKALDHIAARAEEHQVLHVRIMSASRLDAEDLVPAAQALKRSRASRLHVRVDRHG
jgi:hypothetical protein